MGYPELLRVVQEEAAREVREIRDAAARECTRLLDEARSAAAEARRALLERADAELHDRARAASEELARERERALLVAKRAALDETREAVREALARAGSSEVDARLLRELLPEVGTAPFTVVVDPGAEEACRASLARIDPGAAARADVRAAPAPRGGVEVIVDRRVLDDTLPSRLERLWPEREARLVELLLGEDG